VGFLTEEESGSLRISKMILHVVGGEGDFVPQAERNIEHPDFFIERIRDTDAAAVYNFTPQSATKAQLERVARGEDSFEAGAQGLAREFSRLHSGSTVEGAFFIFELETDQPQTKLYSFIKYDYREAIEQAEGNDGNRLLRRIVQAFITDRRAIQKSVIVRVVNGVGEASISVRDRAHIAPDIGHYFVAFLDVTRTRSNQELNKCVANLLQDALAESQNELPNGDVAGALRRAKGILHDRPQITEAEIVDAVLAAAGNPDDERTRTKLQRRVRRRIQSQKLDGLAFPTDRNILRRPALRRLRTAEGVVVYYPDAADGGSLRREARPGGGEIITIETEEVKEDRVVRENARGAT